MRGVEIVASPEAADHIRAHGGTLWVWLDPHTWVGAMVYTYLQCATEYPGSTRATKRLRAARRSHVFHTYEAEGFTVEFEYGIFGPPQELHLAMKRIPKRRVEAYWNGAVFVGEDIPPPAEW